jgi:uncharacterized protein (DUF1015 family)
VPDIRPFRGLRYDPLSVPDLNAVLCPPYDIIEPDQRARLAARDPRNAVHVELPVGGPGSDPQAAYQDAAALFGKWLADGTLRRDDRPLVYVYEQRYSLADGSERAADGGEQTARGFFCHLALEPFGPASGVRAHERTMAAPKQDRYRLLSAVRANLSPIVLLYEVDADGTASSPLLERLTQGRPEQEALDDDGVRHRLWAVDPAASEDAAALLGLAGRRPLSIADGHHRYETALAYRDEQRASVSATASAADYVLALLFDAQSGGLSVLPTHRVVRGLPESYAFLTALEELFTVTRQRRSGDLLDVMRRTTVAANEWGSGRLGVWTRGGGALVEVDRERIDDLLPAGRSEALRALDVTSLSVCLERVVGRSASDLAADGRMVYTKDPQQAVELVDSGQADAAFVLAPTPIDAVLAVAAAGEQMPEKSTYFHPKAATGLVFNPLAE